jgi:hypothetical protein
LWTRRFVLVETQIFRQIEPVKWIFDSFTKLLGLLSFCLIAATTVHDWGYFYIVGSKFRSIQTTYDYFAYAIEWMPPLFLLVLVAWGISDFSTRKLAARAAEGLSGQAERRFRQRRFVYVLLLFFLASVSLMIFVLLPYPRNLPGLVLTILAILTLVFVYAVKSVVQYSLIFAASVALIYFVGLAEGIGDVTREIRTASNVHTMQLKGMIERHVMLLRTFEKGILIRNPSNDRVEFIRWDQVEMLSHRASPDLQPGGCRWLGLFCREVVTP